IRCHVVVDSSCPNTWATESHNDWTTTTGSPHHVDVKKLGRIPQGGGWRLHGRHAKASMINLHKKIKIGYDYVHTAIDDHSRLAYSEVNSDEKDPTCAAFLHRALSWFAGHGVRVRRLLTDNAWVYRRGTDWGGCVRPGSSNADSSNRAAHGPTAKPNASTGPCSPNGPTPVPGHPTASAHEALTDSLTTTTLGEATPPSAADHPSAGSPPDNNVSGHDT
ncbi:DDE-type integrase/transposase/recombinase, partial [Mycolicibacterium sp. 050232]